MKEVHSRPFLRDRQNVYAYRTRLPNNDSPFPYYDSQNTAQIGGCYQTGKTALVRNKSNRLFLLAAKDDEPANRR
ncbi:hypothetical protein GGP41_006042 [Bipolaris sorokiniana]|uniref:Uncharacterized protein n=1 Tax=Cochliobolus sativus TaxID=45130 RepID=A0A8H5ZFA1_COCSA|nr:hypothetical protein GGP41_006042 [Bipolaris sorokiniana]